MDQKKNSQQFLFRFSKENRLDRARRAKGLLQTALLLIITILTSYLLIRIIPDFRLNSPEIIMISILLVIVLAYILLRRGYFFPSSIITVLVTFFGMTFISLTSMGIRDAGVFTYLIIIFFTAILLGKIASLIITLLSIIAIWVMIYFENHELLVYDPWSIEMIGRDYTFIFLSAMGLTIFYDTVLSRYIKDLKDSRSAYLKVNKKLKKRNNSILKINDELKISKEKAEESDRLKSAFLANLSHEIRTPMNGIIGFSELMLASEVSDSDKEEYNKIIAKSCNQLLGVVNDIIDISKIESGIIDVTLTDFNINKLLQDIYDLNSRSAQHMDLEFSLTTGLEDEVANIHSDEVKVQQIISNLIGNAIKFTSTGTVKFGYTLEDNELLFFVSDTGIGISKEYQERVFERFLQENIGPNRDQGGTGLGLSIAKAYVEKLGGEISVESDGNKGSRFSFSIPYNKAKAASNESHLPKGIEQERIVKVMIVEDVEINEMMLLEMLKKYPFEVIVARTGEEAVKMFEESEDLGLIFMDIKLPGMTGYEATRIIRQQNKSIPIIAQTAHAFITDRNNALDAGCNDIITKPIVQKVLDEAILKALN